MRGKSSSWQHCLTRDHTVMVSWLQPKWVDLSDPGPFRLDLISIPNRAIPVFPSLREWKSAFGFMTTVYLFLFQLPSHRRTRNLICQINIQQLPGTPCNSFLKGPKSLEHWREHCQELTFIKRSDIPENETEVQSSNLLTPWHCQFMMSNDRKEIFWHRTNVSPIFGPARLLRTCEGSVPQSEHSIFYRKLSGACQMHIMPWIWLQFNPFTNH